MKVYEEHTEEQLKFCAMRKERNDLVECIYYSLSDLKYCLRLLGKIGDRGAFFTKDGQLERDLEKINNNRKELLLRIEKINTNIFTI